MFIKTLETENIRLLKKLKIENTDKINYILGKNAQGKSTVLEAIYILCTSKSNRTFKDKEFITFGEEISVINADIEREKRPDINLRIVTDRNHRKAYFADNAKKSRIGEGIGELNSVIFSAADIEMIKGDPVSRRNYINLEISQIFPAYIQNYANYKKALAQRNNILKDIKNNIRESYDLLDVLDIQLSIWGAELISKRHEFTEKINLYSKEIYNITSDENSGFDIKYLSNPFNEAWDKTSLRENIMAHLREKRNTDIKMGTTVTGPHRDDISIKINNYPVKYYGSGGEMRSAAFALKMSEIEIIKEIWEEYPIVLLDDLMSELDINRREKAVEIAKKNCQVFITTTHLDNINYKKEETSLYYLEKGKLTGEQS